MSMWGGCAKDADTYSLASPNFDPASRKDEIKMGKPIGFEVLSGGLTLIEKLKGSGKNSKKTMTVVLSNVFRLLLHFNPDDLVPAIYFVSNKVAPDYDSCAQQCVS